MLGHRGVGLSAGGFVVFWSFPVWHVPGRVLLFTLHSSEYSPPCCLFSCATTPEECAPGESDTEEHCDHYTDVRKTQMEMLPLLVSIRRCVLYYVMNWMCKNTGLLFCLNVLDYFIFYFAYFLHINTGQQHSGGFLKWSTWQTGRTHTVWSMCENFFCAERWRRWVSKQCHSMRPERCSQSLFPSSHSAALSPQ